jgi:exopolysaccharide production protein ExoQ
MSYITLVFALGLAIVCLRQDAKLEPNVSFAIWLPVLWMLRVASRSFGEWFPGEGNQWVEQIILSALTIAGLMVLTQRNAKVSGLFRENRVLLLFLAYVTLSILWSSDISFAFKRWFRTVGDVTMALLVLTELNPFVAVLCVLRRAIMVLIPLSLVLCMYFHSLGWGVNDSWVGVSVDKNWFGLLCFVASAYLLWHWTMRRRKSEWAKNIRVAGIPFEIPLLVISLYLLFGGSTGSVSRSSTAIVLLALAVGVFYLTEYVRKRHLRLASLVIPFVLLFLFVQVLPRLTGHRSLTDHIIEDVLHKDVNLTDRADFWPLLLHKGMAHPWFGSGFDSFFTPQMQDRIETELAMDETYFKPNQAHNGYLEVFLSLGVTGLALLMLVIYSAFRSAPRLNETSFEYGQMRLALLACVLVSNWTESSFARPTEFFWFLFLLVAINPVGDAMQVSAGADANQATDAEKAHVWADFPSAGHATTLSHNTAV